MATKKTEEQKAAEAQAKAEAKAAKEAAKAEKKPVAADKREPDEKNGVIRPSSGKTKQVWDVADEMSKAAKAPVDRKSLTDRLLAEPYSLVVGTIHTQYGKWRKYHGLVVAKEAAPATPAAPVPPAPPAAV